MIYAQHQETHKYMCQILTWVGNNPTNRTYEEATRFMLLAKDW